MFQHLLAVEDGVARAVDEPCDAGSGEQWMTPAGGTLLGISRTVAKGRTVAHEFMQIRGRRMRCENGGL